MREARRSTSFKYTTWVLAMQCGWTLMSIRIHHPFHGGQSLPARQEDSKLEIGRTCISITMKFIKGYHYPFSFVVIVCKRNLSMGLEGAWKHIRTLEWKWKNRCNSSYFGNGKIFGARRGVDPYHLDLVLLSLFF